MFERITEPARKSFEIANDEARRRNHKCIGTEHMLLGLLQLPESDAAAIIEELADDPAAIQHRIDELSPPGELLSPEDSSAATKRLIQTEHSRKVVEYAIIEARSLEHNWIGTGHLLLALLIEPLGTGGRVLRELGLTAERANEVFVARCKSGLSREESVQCAEKVRHPAMAASPRFENLSNTAQRVLALANREAMRFDRSFIGTEHILLGLIRSKSTGKTVLQTLEVDLFAIESEIAKRSQPSRRDVGSSALHAIERAVQESRELKHNQVGTGHLLIGLVAEQDGLGGMILREFGLDAAKVREAVLAVLANASEES